MDTCIKKTLPELTWISVTNQCPYPRDTPNNALTGSAYSQDILTWSSVLICALTILGILAIKIIRSVSIKKRSTTSNIPLTEPLSSPSSSSSSPSSSGDLLLSTSEPVASSFSSPSPSFSSPPSSSGDVLLSTSNIQLTEPLPSSSSSSSPPSRSEDVLSSTSNIQLTEPLPSSPSSRWDVFLSFYGKDTRGNFITHLYNDLDQAGFPTFKDDPALDKGQDISSGLLDAIKDSKMFVVVISENYAHSAWCLDELTEMLRCNKTGNQVVPVFYYVNPSHVGHHTGSFGIDLQYHVDKKRYSDDRIRTWKSALAQIAKISGYHLVKHTNENESTTIKEIVENVAKQLPKELHLEKGLFGIDSAVEEIYQKIRMELNHVLAIGIWGMGGIGKTTTAKAFYNKYSNKFKRSCFIDKVKQYSQGGSCDLLPLLNQALTGLLGKDYKVADVASGFRQLKHKLSSNKSLIVLDDLDEASYSEFLKDLCNSFSAGSRIIVTTRDVNLLNQLKRDIKEVDIHMAKELGNDDSLKLFCYHAFGTHTPDAHLREHSKSLVSYAGGLPLALKVLGSSLRGRSHVSFWLKKLEEVKKIPPKKILEILLLSYHDLSSDTEKAFFLDIACFFVGKHKVDAVEIFKSSTSYPEVEITILVERCLLEIDEKGKFRMHDLLQDMGRELGKSTHLFWRGNALGDLQNQEGKEKIEALILDLTVSKEKLISSEIFKMLPKLRLLEIVCAQSIEALEGDFVNSFHDLECIYWSYCSWTQLPSSFHPQKLICLSMPYSNFKRLWNNTPAFKDLKIINLTHSLELESTPDFGNSKSVKRLSFFGCVSLLEVHPSIRDLTDLHHLDIRGCTQLKELSHLKRSPEPIKHWARKGFLAPKQLDDMKELKELAHLKRSPEPIKLWASMVFLGLSHCSNLARLPKQLGDMKGLQLIDASHTAIEELPDSITHLKRLLELVLSNCNKLSKLPEDIGNMEGLMVFNACYSAIEQLPDSFAGLIELVKLDLTGCKNLRNLPNSIWKLELLQVLYLSHCSNLEGLPDELGNMQCLEILFAAYTAIEQIPDSIQQLSRLQKLDLTNCDKLRYVPDSVWNLASLKSLYILQSVIGCRNNLPNTVKNTKLTILGLSCDIRSWFPMLQSFSSLEELYIRDEDDGESLSSAEPISLSELYNLQVLELYSSTWSLFPELPPNLTYLSIFDHETLVYLPDLSGLKQLNRLDILGYERLESLPPLPPSLQSLMVWYCRSLQVPSDMSMLNKLVEFNFGRCNVEVKGFQAMYLEFAEWFRYKSSVRRFCCDIPPLLGDDFLGLAIWVLFFTKIKERTYIKVVVTSKINGITECYWIPLLAAHMSDVYSVAKCISRDQISITSGDRIEISFERQLYCSVKNEFPSYEEVQVVKCAAHVIQKTPFTPDFPSFFNNLISGGKWKINKSLSSKKKTKIYDDWGWGLDRMVKIAGGISHHSYQLSEDSMLSLAPNTWIDDRIIYGYMTLLRDREKGIEDEKLWERKPSYYFMDPMFMQLAKTENYKNPSSFETLHRFYCDWATSSVGPSINTVDHIFVPACVNENHWIVFVFAVKEWAVILLDSQNDDPHYPEEEEVMVGLVPAMLRYCGRNQFSYPNEDASFHVLKRRPTQSNSSDCGIYVMKFMDYILQGFTIGDFTWWPEDIETFRCRIARELQKGKARHIPGFFMLQRLENAST